MLDIDTVSFRWRYWHGRSSGVYYGEWVYSREFNALADSNVCVRSALEEMWRDYQSRENMLISGEFQVHETFDSDGVWEPLTVETVMLYLLGV